MCTHLGRGCNIKRDKVPGPRDASWVIKAAEVARRQGEERRYAQSTETEEVPICQVDARVCRHFAGARLNEQRMS